MTHMLNRLRERMTYANVMATLALFVALGGSSYAAATLARNSVGSAQIRTSAVGTSEIRNGSVALRDLAASTRTSLRGTQGPAGPAGPSGTADRAAINSGGGKVFGTARDNVTHVGGSNEYTVEFTHDVSGCVYAATLAAVQNGATLEQPPAGGRITAATTGGASVVVRTYSADGSAAPAPFHLLVSC